MGNLVLVSITTLSIKNSSGDFRFIGALGISLNAQKGNS